MLLRNALLISTLMLSLLSTNAQTVNSISDGAATATSTWDCACVPNATNDVVIHHHVALTGNGRYNDMTVKSGASFTSSGSGNTKVFGNLVVEMGAILTNDRQFNVYGNYTMDGKHGGTASIRIRGAGNVISGSAGSISNTARFQLRDGEKIIPIGSTIMATGGRTQLYSGVTVQNYGTYQASTVRGAAGTSWVNHANAWVGVRGTWNNNCALDAQSIGNTVVFGRLGSNNQTMVDPIASTYYNLEIEGDDASSRKKLRNDVVIEGDLTIGTSTLDPRNSGTNHNILLKGDWKNQSGLFRSRTSEVTLEANSGIEVQHSAKETFYNVRITGSDSVLLKTDIELAGSLEVAGLLDLEVAANHTVEVGGDLTVTGNLLAREGEMSFINSGDKHVYGSVELFDLSINTSDNVVLESPSNSVRGALALNNGILETNDELTLISDENGTARIAEVMGGAMLGEVNVQRYIDAGATDWRFLTSQVGGNTLADWDDDFVTSGYAGSDFPSFPFTSIHTYDESQPGTQDDGFVPASSSSDAINIGEGYWVWCGDSLGGTAPFTIDVKGAANIGDINLPVQYTVVSGAANDGWCMVGNPYASTIDWDDADWTKTNMDDAIYIWDPDNHQFASYVNGVGVNGGSSLIASGQAFWVKANGPAPVLEAKEGVKSAIDAAFKNNVEVNGLTLSLIQGHNYDQAKLRTIDGASDGFDNSFDALKMFSTDPDVPSISTLIPGNIDLSINSFPLANTDIVIPVRTTTGVSGSHVIKVTNISGEFAASCIKLEDSYTGDITILSEGETYAFNLSDTTDAPRFLLHVSVPVRNEVTDAVCAGSTNGSAVVIGVGNGPWDYVWYNEQGVAIQDMTGATAPGTIDDLVAGSYTVVVNSNGDCPSISVPFEVVEPEPMSISYGVTSASCTTTNDGAIELEVDGGTAPYNFSWANGSQSQNQVGLSSGDHTITISDANHCEQAFTLNVQDLYNVVADYSVTETEIYLSDGGEVSFTNNSTDAVEYEWEFGDGSPIEFGLDATHTYIASGIYLAKLSAINQACSDEHIKVIKVINDLLDIADINSAEGLHIERNEQGSFLVIQMDQPTELTVQVFNALGQEVTESQNGSYVHHRIELAPNTRNNMLLVSVTNEASGEVFTQKVLN